MIVNLYEAIGGAQNLSLILSLITLFLILAFGIIKYLRDGKSSKEMLNKILIEYEYAITDILSDCIKILSKDMDAYDTKSEYEKDIIMIAVDNFKEHIAPSIPILSIIIMNMNTDELAEFLVSNIFNKKKTALQVQNLGDKTISEYSFLFEDAALEDIKYTRPL